MNEKLLQIINNLEGSLLGIGFEDNILLDAIENNNSIHSCYLLTKKNPSSKKFNMTKKGRNKKINIKKIKKQFKKKSLDTIICNYEVIKPFIVLLFLIVFTLIRYFVSLWGKRKFRKSKTQVSKIY